MHAVLLTVHTLIVAALIGVVLIQRSDGGALGLGGGGGGVMSSRGAADVLTRTTSILAALFFSTSLLLAVTARTGESDADIIQDLTGQEVRDPNAPTTTDDLLRTLGGEQTDAAVLPDAAPALEATPEAAADDADSPTGDAGAGEAGVAAEEDPAPQE
jgi:preprotein translocase subunit SecG